MTNTKKIIAVVSSLVLFLFVIVTSSSAGSKSTDYNLCFNSKNKKNCLILDELPIINLLRKKTKIGLTGFEVNDSDLEKIKITLDFDKNVKGDYFDVTLIQNKELKIKFNQYFSDEKIKNRREWVKNDVIDIVYLKSNDLGFDFNIFFKKLDNIPNIKYYANTIEVSIPQTNLAANLVEDNLTKYRISSKRDHGDINNIDDKIDIANKKSKENSIEYVSFEKSHYYANKELDKVIGSSHFNNFDRLSRKYGSFKKVNRIDQLEDEFNISVENDLDLDILPLGTDDELINEFLEMDESDFVDIENSLDWKVITRDFFKEIDNIKAIGESNDERLSIKDFSALVRVAVEDYPQTMAIVQKRKQAEATFDSAKSDFLPQVDITAGFGSQDIEASSNSNGTSTGKELGSITISQLLFDFGATKDKVSAARSRLDKSIQSTLGMQQDMSLKAIEAHLEYFKSKVLLNLAIKQSESAEKLVSLLEQKENLGGASINDISRAKIKYAEAIEKIPELNMSLQNAEARYYEIFVKSPVLDSYSGFFPADPDLSKIKNMDPKDLFSKYPSILEMKNEIDALKYDLNYANKKKFGGIYIEGSSSQTKDGYSSGSFTESSSVMLTFRNDIFTGGKKQSQVNLILAQLNEKKYQLSALEREYLFTLNRARHLMEAEEKKYLASRQIIFETQKSYEGTLELYLARRGGLIDVFSVQDAMFNAGSRFAAALVTRTLAKFKYLHTAGQLRELVFREI